MINTLKLSLTKILQNINREHIFLILWFDLYSTLIQI